MTIGEVARKASLRPSAIRYYERLGLLPMPPRVSGQRRYDHQVLERLAIVRFAKHVGFEIADIRRLLEGIDGRPPPQRWRSMARQRMAEVEQLIREAISIRKLLDHTLRQKCPQLVERGAGLTACPYGAIAKFGRRRLPAELRRVQPTSARSSR